MKKNGDISLKYELVFNKKKSSYRKEIGGHKCVKNL
mgnify:CR=1 FL=1